MTELAQTLSGRVVAVTGAGRGLGRSHALRLAADGAAVVVNDIDGDCAATVAAEIVATGGIAIASSDTITTPDGAARLAEACIAEFSRIDALICNAGIVRYGSIVDATIEDLQAQLDVSLWGSIHPIRAVWSHLVAQRFGRIVLTTSQAGLWGWRQMAGYAMSKSALVGLGRSLAGDVPEGCDIRINLIAPSGLTRLSEDAIPEYLRDAMSPANVSPLVSYLCSRNCQESGMIFNVGGGRVRRVRIVESAVAEVPQHGFWQLPAALDEACALPEARDMMEAGSHIVPDLSAAQSK